VAHPDVWAAQFIDCCDHLVLKIFENELLAQEWIRDNCPIAQEETIRIWDMFDA
jgi:hypothetical protein